MITLEEPEKLARAIGWMRRGMDFADALHLAKADACSAFLSFDRKLARLAATSGAMPVEEP
jgi:predicted nucleic acid-binding protein